MSTFEPNSKTLFLHIFIKDSKVKTNPIKEKRITQIIE